MTLKMEFPGHHVGHEPKHLQCEPLLHVISLSSHQYHQSTVGEEEGGRMGGWMDRIKKKGKCQT